MQMFEVAPQRTPRSASHGQRCLTAAPLPSPTTLARYEMRGSCCTSATHPLPQATSRLSKNIKYFRVNYAMIILATTALCFLASPSALLVLAFLAAVWFFLLVLRPGPIEIGGRVFGYVQPACCTRRAQHSYFYREREKFLGLSAFSLVVAFFLSRYRVCNACCVRASHTHTTALARCSSTRWASAWLRLASTVPCECPTTCFWTSQRYVLEIVRCSATTRLFNDAPCTVQPGLPVVFQRATHCGNGRPSRGCHGLGLHSCVFCVQRVFHCDSASAQRCAGNVYSVRRCCTKYSTQARILYTVAHGIIRHSLTTRSTYPPPISMAQLK